MLEKTKQFYQECSDEFLMNMKNALILDRARAEVDVEFCNQRLAFIDQLLLDRSKPYPERGEQKPTVSVTGPMR